MPQFRKDPVNGRWVIVNMETPRVDFHLPKHASSTKTCPFCPGNEAMTPPAIMTYPAKNPAESKSAWQLRVIPNKFPALRIEESAERTGIGIYDRIGGFGAHEVIIESPDHHRDIADLSPADAELILRVYRDRCLDLRKDKRIHFILIFKNQGWDAGASLEHPHSQLIGLPIVPSRLLGEVRGSADHFAQTERCIHCDMLDQEKLDKKLTIFSNDDFMAITPFASRFPFEVWILPKNHAHSFDSITDEKLPGLASALQATLRKLKKLLGNPAYNFMIYTSPIHGREAKSFHWHIEVIPHLTEVAGFELGTGFYLNPTPAELAAEQLRSVEGEMS